ncbi:hypothetical protein Lal_00042174 [Lupinus albus]|nr:hypothetical protein Lal_00042174 [Lupinus albus]
MIKFWEDLEGVVQTIPLGENIFLRGGLNGHVGRDTRGFEGFISDMEYEKQIMKNSDEDKA